MSPERHTEASLELRPAIPGDAPAITACVHRAFEHYIPRIGRPPRPMTHDYAQIVAERPAWVATVDEAVAGVLVLDLAHGFKLDIIAVDPAMQGRGVGRALLELAEREARARGYDEINLSTNEKMTENRALYARIGYIEVEHVVENGYARVLMRKPL